MYSVKRQDRNQCLHGKVIIGVIEKKSGGNWVRKGLVFCYINKQLAFYPVHNECEATEGFLSTEVRSEHYVKIQLSKTWNS